MNSTDSNAHRKQSIINTSTCSTKFSFELKGEKGDAGANVNCEPNVSISSLKSRLAPTIRTTLSAAVDTLLGEIVVVLAETQRELVTKEQENEKLKVRLEVSERELKTLQECLCSAQKLIDQLQGPFGGPPPLGPQIYPTPLPGPVNPARLTHRNAHGPDDRCFAGGEPELSSALGDALQGFDSREEFKNCHLSIQADGTVTNQLFDPLNMNPANTCIDVNRSGQISEKRPPLHSGPTPSSHSSFDVKEEKGPGQGPLCGRGPGGPTECEQSAQSVRDLGYIHVVEEEGSSRSRNYPNHSVPKQALPTGSQKSSSSGSPSPPGGSGFSSAQETGPKSGLAARQDPPGVGFSKRPSASEPIGTTSGERPHLCLECGKTFRLISSLKKHIRIHTGEKPYPCPVCGRRFRESGALKTHLRIHTGEKPYACAECGTRFRHLDGLRKHRRTHTGEKPYVCAVCGKRLSRLQHLKHHQRIHTGERPCCCSFCHRGFKDPASLRKHLRTHQGEPGLDGAHEDMGSTGLDDENGGPHAQDSMGEGDVRFGMWGEDEEDEEDGEAVVDCV
ncbi:zinc finger protein 250 [Chanos chanos]|uniref:Zinc finger protein 250 n=1 Tax=Chanos chanos TaxID=29144 RepID=A0A6J2W673_CHACN|nr:zinc finger protein 250-like [Chanos chanos]